MPRTTEDIALSAVGAHVTLNGQPAIISRSVGCALIRTLDGRMVGQYSWLAVARVMENGGAFRI